MSLIRCSNAFDPYQGFPFGSGSNISSLFPSLAGTNSETVTFAGTRIDWKETPEAHVFKADVPGLKEDVKVEVEDGNVLHISGERSKEQEKNDKWHRVECSSVKSIQISGLLRQIHPDLRLDIIVPA